MAYPNLKPESKTSRSILTSTGSVSEVATYLPFGIYASSPSFLSGAVDQVSFTYRKLGGNILDIELHTSNIYAAYEEATLEYSYIVNIHQAKNSLSDLLGAATASFDQDGNITNALSSSHVNLAFPRFSFAYGKQVGDGIGGDVGAGGSLTEHSASFDRIVGQQDYDLQDVVANNVNFSGSVGNKKIRITKVFFQTPQAAWRFYGYYGGLNVVGNLTTYGQYADDSTFQLIPVWQNKLQAMHYKDTMYVRNSHYSYELINNKLRIFPTPWEYSPRKFWFKFTLDTEPWEEDAEKEGGIHGINNMNTLPFDNVPYESINAIGKQWIRRYALALSKEMLGQIRGKIKSIPIPGNDITLNADELLGQAQEEKTQLRDELKTILDEMTYAKLSEIDSMKLENVEKSFSKYPLPIYVK